MIELESERLVLRNFEPTDWEDMLEISLQYEQTDMAQYDQEYPQTPEEMKELVGMLGSGDEFAAVALKSQPKVIGLIQFQRKKKYVDEVVHGFGAIFNSDYQGKGYALEASKTALEYLFEELAIDRCIAGTAVANTKSRKLTKRLGFREVTQKQIHFRNDSTGNPINFMYVIYELSRQDWESMK